MKETKNFEELAKKVSYMDYVRFVQHFTPEQEKWIKERQEKYIEELIEFCPEIPIRVGYKEGKPIMRKVEASEKKRREALDYMFLGYRSPFNPEFNKDKNSWDNFGLQYSDMLVDDSGQKVLSMIEVILQTTVRLYAMGMQLPSGKSIQEGFLEYLKYDDSIIQEAYEAYKDECGDYEPDFV